MKIAWVQCKHSMPRPCDKDIWPKRYCPICGRDYLPYNEYGVEN